MPRSSAGRGHEAAFLPLQETAGLLESLLARAVRAGSFQPVLLEADGLSARRMHGMLIFHIATVVRLGPRPSSPAPTRPRPAVGPSSRRASCTPPGASRSPGVFDRYYPTCGEPLVLLTIDTDRLDVPWREDEVGDDTFPHIYGPLSPAAVVEVQPLDKAGGTL